jgi:Tfp pilus assembly protein PilV
VFLAVVWLVVVVLALVVLGVIAHGLLGAAGRLRREMEAAERDVAPLLEQMSAAQAAAEARDRAPADT